MQGGESRLCDTTFMDKRRAWCAARGRGGGGGGTRGRPAARWGQQRGRVRVGLHLWMSCQMGLGLSGRDPAAGRILIDSKLPRRVFTKE